MSPLATVKGLVQGMKRQLVPLALAFTSTCALLLFTQVAWAAKNPAGSTANPIPPFTVSDTQGITHEVNWAGDKTKLTIIFFFEPRTVSSLKAIDFFNKINRFSGHRGLDLFAVEASGLEAEDAAWQMSQYERLYSKPSFPIIPDPHFELSRLFNLQDVPSAFFVNRSGEVTFQTRGFNKDLKLEMTRKVAGAIKKDTEGFINTSVGSTGSAGESASTTNLSSSGGRSSVFAASRRPRLKVGDKVAPFRVVDFEKKIHEFKWGPEDPEISIVFFWGAMCLPCMAEMSYLDALNKLAHEGKLRILSVQATGLDEKQTKMIMKRFRKFYDYPSYPMISDPHFSICELFGVDKGGPATFIMDSSGKATYYTGDFVQETKEELARVVGDLIVLPDPSVKKSLKPQKAVVKVARGGVAVAPSIARKIAENEYLATLSKANRLCEEKKYSQAIPIYLNLVDKNPKSVELRMKLAETYRAESRYIEAMEQWEIVLKYEKDHKKAQENLDVWRDLTGQLE